MPKRTYNHEKINNKPLSISVKAIEVKIREAFAAIRIPIFRSPINVENMDGPFNDTNELNFTFLSITKNFNLFIFNDQFYLNKQEDPT